MCARVRAPSLTREDLEGREDEEACKDEQHRLERLDHHQPRRDEEASQQRRPNDTPLEHLLLIRRGHLEVLRNQGCHALAVRTEVDPT